MTSDPGERALRHDPPKARSWSSLGFIVGILVVGTWLRLIDLNGLSLWVDEAFTWSVAKGSLASILRAELDLHPPVYLAALHLLFPFFGDGEYALRFPSAICSVLGVVGVWVAARRYGGVPAAIVASTMLAIAPLAVAYAREARMYGLAIGFSALVIATATVVIKRPTHAAWLLYIVANVLAILTHYTALAVWSAGALMTLQSLRQASRSWILAQSVIASVAFLWALVVWRNREAWQGLSWHPWAGSTSPIAAAIDWSTGLAGFPLGPTNLVTALNAPNGTLALTLSVVIVLLIFAGAIHLFIKGSGWVAFGLLVGAFAPFIALNVVDGLRPTWAIRYALVSLPPSVILVALGATMWPRGFRVVNVLIAGSLILAQYVGLRSARPDAREDWRAIAAYVLAASRPGDTALVGVEALGRYYLAGLLPVLQRPIALGRSGPDILPDLNRAVASRTGVWLIPKEDRLMDPSNAVETLLVRYIEAREDVEIGGARLSRLTLRQREQLTIGRGLRSIAARFGPSIQLHEYTIEKVVSGGRPTIQLSLSLSAATRLSIDYKLFSHLLDSSMRTVAQRDIVIIDAAGHPTSQFEPGRRVRIDLIIEGEPSKIDSGMSVGIGIYEPEGSGARLPLEPSAPENRLILPLAE